MQVPQIAVPKIHMVNKIDPTGMTRLEYLNRIEQPLHPTDIPLDWFHQAPTYSEYLNEVPLQVNCLEVQDMTPEE